MYCGRVPGYRNMNYSGHVCSIRSIPSHGWLEECFPAVLEIGDLSGTQESLSANKNNWQYNYPPPGPDMHLALKICVCTGIPESEPGWKNHGYHETSVAGFSPPGKNRPSHSHSSRVSGGGMDETTPGKMCPAQGPYRPRPGLVSVAGKPNGAKFGHIFNEDPIRADKGFSGYSIRQPEHESGRFGYLFQHVKTTCQNLTTINSLPC